MGATMTNSEKLKAIMKRHGLTIEDVAGKLECGRDSVTSWLRPPGGKAQRAMHGSKMRLLELVLASEEAKKNAKGKR